MIFNRRRLALLHSVDPLHSRIGGLVIPRRGPLAPTLNSVDPMVLTGRIRCQSRSLFPLFLGVAKYCWSRLGAGSSSSILHHACCREPRSILSFPAFAF